MLRRVQEMRIDYLEWHTGESREAALVLVSAEAASSKDLVKYARRLIAEQKLDQIVVDECHLTMIATVYRPSIIELTAILSLRIQFVYFTAPLRFTVNLNALQVNFWTVNILSLSRLSIASICRVSCSCSAWKKCGTAR
jgi:hypothetical protein